MSKINKEEEARRAGMAYALKIIVDAHNSGKDYEESVNALKDELRFRNITKCPLKISEQQVQDFCNEVKANCVTTFKLMTILTLHDEFGFGKKRLEQFMERFMLKTEVIVDDYATWKDYQDIMEEECKIKIDLSEEFLSMTKKEE